MAQSSGVVGGGRPLEAFDASAVRVAGDAARYEVAKTAAGVSVTVAQNERTATRSLDYFIGSGAVGRSYASRVGKFLFQAPVSFYTAAGRWDVSPGFEKASDPGLTRPVEPSCLRCHASQVQHLPGTANGYAEPAFREGGIGCERCHGPGAAHVRAMQSAQTNVKGHAIVNPAKLDPARRDSVCAQCHLSGASEIGRGRQLSAFRAGELFSDYVAVFQWSSKPVSGALAVNSHFERMTQSGCRKAAGPKFWCGTCHDPHDVPAKTAVSSYYRERCFQCHDSQSCTAPSAQRANASDDCIRCHMPRTGAPTVKHAAFTDHSIPRRPVEDVEPTRNPTLVPVFAEGVSDRELGLAHADVALGSNNRVWGMRAFELLQSAVQKHPADARVASQLGQLFDRMKNPERACELYAQAVRFDPTAVAPKINLGACFANQGQLEEAMKLWADVVERAPGMEAARSNLAVAQYQRGAIEAARSTLAEGLRINPFSERLSELLKQVESTKAR